MSLIARLGIVLIGSRGIPPRYGGAETFVYELSKRLKDYFNVYVTCESRRFAVDTYEGVTRIHIYALQPCVLTIPIIYDVIATLYALMKAQAQVFYYVAPDGAYAALIARLAGKRVIVNTDGLEWKRLLQRKNFALPYVRFFHVLTATALLMAEFLACKIPHATIADSITIKNYLKCRWKPKKVYYVAYGIRQLPRSNSKESMRMLSKYDLTPFSYYLTIGRFVPENNLHTVIQAFKNTRTASKLVFIGLTDPHDSYTRYLFKLREGDRRILLLRAIYDLKSLAALRANCRAYIHPYTIGGTNPSLLEQLQFDRPIIAYDAPFHREVLRDKGIYFKTFNELTKIIARIDELKTIESVPWNDLHIKIRFSWSTIAESYKKIFTMVMQQ